MSNLLVQELSGLFLAFCRIGGCLMLMPGFSNPRIPVQVRLFMAFAAFVPDEWSAEMRFFFISINK